LAIAIITVTTGTAAAGVTAATGIVIMNGAATTGVDMIMAIIVAGISVTLMSAATVRAGETVTTIVGPDAATVMGIIADTKKEPHGSFFIIPEQC
jgi:hypothetical protein